MPEPEPEAEAEAGPKPELGPQVGGGGEEGVEGPVAGVLRHGPAGWTVPRLVGKCRRKVEAATPRLPLGLLQHERLVEHCPGALRWWGPVETIGGCFGAAVNSSSDALREEAGHAVEIGNDGKPVVARASRHGRLLKHYEAIAP